MAIRTLPSPRCPGCALPRPAGTDLVGPATGRCATCVLRPAIADRVFAAVAYDAVARRFLLRAKFGRRPELLRPLGGQLARSLELDRFARDCTLVAAVPSLPWTTLRRGFSPAVELARPVASCLQLPLYGRMVRRRIGAGGPAKRMGARARRLALRAAFAVRGALNGERVLLIDDVMTTGATADSCALALREAGASEVRVGVWARTLPRSWSSDTVFDRG